MFTELNDISTGDGTESHSDYFFTQGVSLNVNGKEEKEKTFRIV